jgi:anti-sigma factor RsiW
MASVFDRMRFRRDHRWTPRRMSAYLDGELPRRRRARLERHLRECPECRGVLGALQRMLALIKHTAPASTRDEMPDIPSAVRARLRRHDRD